MASICEGTFAGYVGTILTDFFIVCLLTLATAQIILGTRVPLRVVRLYATVFSYLAVYELELTTLTLVPNLFFKIN